MMKFFARAFTLMLLATFLYFNATAVCYAAAVAKVKAIVVQSDMDDLKKSHIVEVELPEQFRGEDVFVVKPILKPSFFMVFDLIDNDGDLVLGNSLYAERVEYTDKDKVFLFRINISEGIPSLAMLVFAMEQNGEYCLWYPRYNGINGKLELDEGFQVWK